MSRKKARESNTPQIGIFLDKKSANYNLSILKVLLSQGRTAWSIAEILHEKDHSEEIKQEIKDTKRYHTQKIYSVIQRENGRLSDLKEKGYLKEENGIWNLTKKGFIALSIKEPDLVKSEIQKNPESLLEVSKEYFNSMPKGMTKIGLGIYLDYSELKPELEKLDKISYFWIFIAETKDLLTKGIELDRINADDLPILAGNRLRHSKKA